MNRSRIWAVTALLIPIMALSALAWQKHRLFTTGTEVTFAIQGFDPRDLLSGHYLIYRIDYQAEDPCQADNGQTEHGSPVWLCIEPRAFHLYAPSRERCPLTIPGRCEKRRFKAGLERFYIPEEEARPLDRLVRNSRGSLIVSVTPRGGAVVKELLIDDQPWREFLAASEKK
ncbi:MAG: GDYXXLXY domain-containing protein [Magnetococcales bacterium]|nr:GDYXXLXY domain-containing protein [Magnetococcales bacterium]